MHKKRRKCRKHFQLQNQNVNLRTSQSLGGCTHLDGPQTVDDSLALRRKSNFPIRLSSSFWRTNNHFTAAIRGWVSWGGLARTSTCTHTAGPATRRLLCSRTVTAPHLTGPGGRTPGSHLRGHSHCQRKRPASHHSPSDTLATAEKSRKEQNSPKAPTAQKTAIATATTSTTAALKIPRLQNSSSAGHRRADDDRNHGNTDAEDNDNDQSSSSQEQKLENEISLRTFPVEKSRHALISRGYKRHGRAHGSLHLGFLHFSQVSGEMWARYLFTFIALVMLWQTFKKICQNATTMSFRFFLLFFLLAWLHGRELATALLAALTDDG